MAMTDAGCADLLTDPKNCGACGHDCRGGTCAAGACASISLVTSVTVSWLDADDNGAYFVKGDPVAAAPAPAYRVSPSGGIPLELGGSFAPLQTSTTTTMVVGVAPGTGLVGVKKDRSGGGLPVALLSVTIQPNSLASGGGPYAVLAVPGDPLRIVHETTGAAATFTDDATGPRFTFVGPSSVVSLATTAALPNGGVVTIGLPPGASGSAPAAQPIALTSTACLVAGSRLLCATGNSFATVPLATPSAAPTTLVAADSPSNPGNYPRGFAADADTVYWYQKSTHSLLSCPLTGCSSGKVLAADVGDGALVAVSSKLVYFSDPKTETLRAIAK